MEPVIVAHGLWMPGFETGVLRRRLAAAGFEPHLFRFRTVRETLLGNAERLARFSEQVGGDRVHYVGYSLGGVVAVTMLQTFGRARPGRAVCLGAPLNGSAAGSKLETLPGGTRVLGRSMRDLIERGGVDAWRGPGELGIVAGTLGIGLGRMLGGLPLPNDGTVGVVETELVGATDHITLPVSHTTMMFSERVAYQVACFLRGGRFER